MQNNFTDIFFDLDGTLTNSQSGIINSVLYALDKMKIQEPDVASLSKFIGPPLKNSFQLKYDLTNEQSNRAVGFYREYFSEKGLFENELYDGIIEVLSAIKQTNIQLWVVTSKPKIYAEKIVSYFNISSYFQDVIGSNLDNSLTDKTELIAHTLAKIGFERRINKQNIVMIGDREHDIIGAKNNGIKSCGVLYGYGSNSEITQSVPDFISYTTYGLMNILLPNYS